MEPGYPPALLGLGTVQLEAGFPDDAHATLEQAAGAAGGSPLFDASLAYACATTGREARAREILARMEQAQPKSPFLIALVHAGLGADDAAFEWLERALAERDPRARFLSVDARLEPLREDPRFESLARRFRLTGRSGPGLFF
jgi:hypothetical protein